MPRDKQAHVSQSFIFICILSLTMTYIPINAELTSLARNDSYPVYSTLNLDDTFLLTAEQLRYKEIGWAEQKKSHAIFSVSPFGQNADRGRTIRGERFPLAVPNNQFDPGTGPQTYNTTPMIVPLGDITGRMGMIALTYGNVPTTATMPLNAAGMPALAPTLGAAKTALFTNPKVPQTEAQIDPEQLFGYFSTIINYRKRGVGFQASAIIYKDFGFRIEARVSSIRQVIEDRVDLSNLATFDADVAPQTFEGLPLAEVDQFLMDEVRTIAGEIGLDIGNVIKTGADELRFNLFWRRAFELNADVNQEWAHLLIIPYAEIAGSVSPSGAENTRVLFNAPFGNNGHSSFGFTTGVNFDFIETIEIGGEVGFTTFFKKHFCNYSVPNSPFQTTMFPFATNVSIKPGHNWHFLARLAAYHFLDNLSMQFEWVVLDHKQDSICLQTPDPNFFPHVLEKRSSYKTKLGNFVLNYDISPNIGIGFLWQIPFSQRDSYRSSTIMGGINVTF